MSDRTRMQIGVKVLAGIALSMCSVAHAQMLDGEQIQMLINQAQEIEGCMSRLDEQSTADLRARSERISVEIDGLCSAGKREQAQQLALAFGREMADSPAMANLQDCAGPLGALLPAALASFHGDAADAVQVCDAR